MYKPEIVFTGKDIARTISDARGITRKQAGEYVDSVFEAMKKELAEGKNISIHGFGRFEQKVRPKRGGINPRTKEKVRIPESRTVVFHPAKALKDKISD
ncbi:MAG: HU family DNA-binding protein [Anaerolactibacter massiliensis]|nr:HU family DNA-binding protein [Anaerolactibacter massiliensis]